MRSDRQSTPETISEPVFYILLSLASGRKHGYAILKDVENLSLSSVKLSTSTLYTALRRLEDQACVERIPASGDPAPGLPRKVYTLTPKGQALLSAEASRIKHLAGLVNQIQDI
jgi:DNA-binding PadR family transcriptional regulator